MKKGVLENFAKFRKTSVPGSLFNEGLRPTTLLKMGLWHRCFPGYFAKFSRTPFLENTYGRLNFLFSE